MSDDGMNRDELSAWALSMKKLLEHGLVSDTIEVLNSVILTNEPKAGAETV
ncbi:MAG: hypothetical protein J6B68_03585 [Lachnospiraceae bacterium]|nr:hypothetical protein [Lachnospiraceae bacterium]